MLIGCRNLKNEVEIEIYLPKERIKFYDGCKINREWNFSDHLEKDSFWIELNKFYRKYARYDTLTNDYIYAGGFIAKKSDLEKEPFIKSDEIIEFDFETSKIKISPSGVKKILNLEPNFNFSRQFIITANKKPILTGYFYSSFSSSYVKHYYIVYEGTAEKQPVSKQYQEREFEIFYNDENRKEFLLDDRYDFKNNVDFYKAFEQSEKIAH